MSSIGVTGNMDLLGRLRPVRPRRPWRRGRSLMAAASAGRPG